jgi:hypothetical protein
MNVTTTDIHELQSIVENMKRHLPALRQSCLDIAEQLYDSVTPDTWKGIGELVENMDRLYRQSRRVAEALAGLPDNDELQTALGHFIRIFPEQFRVMNACMDLEDYRDAADCLKYELSELIRGLSVALGDEIAVMEERFRKNLEYLKSKFPKVHEAVTGVEPDWDNYQIIYSRTGMPNLKIRTGDNRWIRFYSNHDPEAEASRWAAKLAEKIGEHPDIVLYGLGFGYHLLLLGMHVPNLRVFIYEPDMQIFLAAMHAIDLEKLFSRAEVFALAVGDDRVRREQLVFRFMKASKANASVHALPIYEKLSLRHMNAFKEDAKYASMAYFSSMVTYRRFGVDWLRNRLYNLSNILKSPSLGNFKGLLAGKTAVVVGAGPSLEPDIPVLRELKDHAVIIAAGSTIQSLLHFGIKPHIIALIDGGDINRKIYDDPEVRDIPLLFCPAAFHPVVDDHNPEKLIHFYLREDFTTQFLMGLSDQDPLLRPVPSVTGEAIEAAIYMGCSEIVLAGQDLSYPLDKIYSPGAKHYTPEDIEKTLESAKYELENVNGGVNRATHGLVVTLRAIEELLHDYPNIVFTNTSRYGAKIEHTKWEPLERVLERLQGQTVPGDLLGLLSDATDSIYSEHRVREVYARFVYLKKQTDELEEHLDRIARKLEKLPEYSRTKTGKCLRYMQDIEREWGKVVNGVPFMTIMTVLCMNAIRSFDRDRPELEKETDIVRKSQLFTDVLGPLVKSMRSYIPDVKEMLASAEERLKD